MGRKHPAAHAEDAFNLALGRVLSLRGFRTRVLPYAGYANSQAARVMGRIVLSRPDAADQPIDALYAQARRGIRVFLAAPQTGLLVHIQLGEAATQVRSDRGGYFDVELTGHGLTPGWHHADVTCGDTSAKAPVQVIADDVRFGIVSDLDDTCLITSLPRPMLAAYNTFVRVETARRVVPGMSALYRSMLAYNPGAPIFYLSTGAWNTQPIITRFLQRHGFPHGALLMTDWGATETAVFRSGREHKRSQLRRLATEFPNIKWMLVGDDGQHDPEIYDDFAAEYPEHVRAIAIRQLTATQQMLSHGHPLPRDSADEAEVLKVEGPDGYSLFQQLAALRSKVSGRA